MLIFLYNIKLEQRSTCSSHYYYLMWGHISLPGFLFHQLSRGNSVKSKAINTNIFLSQPFF
jgi:hypothetical protein